jgi:acyl-CoA dehydrogenase
MTSTATTDRGQIPAGGLTPEAPAGGQTPHGELTPKQAELQQRARDFVEAELIPLEEESERLNGRLSQARIDHIKAAAIEARLNGGLHSPEYGGQGWTRMEWALVEEQFGRSTNGIYWHIPNAYNVWDHASAEQRERYLRPAIAGQLKDAYAVTEREAGSDPSRITSTAHRTDTGYRLNGEKWFVTSGDVAQVLIVMANVVDGAELHPTLFAVPSDAPGVDCIEDAVIGGIGEGNEMQRMWFTEERLAIAARGVGAMWRLLDETVTWATAREQGGERIYDYQGVSFPLADSAADAAAGRLLMLNVAALADSDADRKIVHHKASMAKLFVSEAAWRCADRCVQAFGGRGYMRSNVAERLLREVRVDRIWEGTSEIQRLIVARGLERRGVEAILH